MHVIAERAPAPMAFLAAFALTAALAAIVPPASGFDGRAHDAELRAVVARTRAQNEASLAALDRGLAAIDAKISAALNTETGCPSPRDREAAVAKLGELRRQQAELRRKMRQMWSNRWICRLPRREARRVVIDRACVENPLARGCM